MNEFIARKGFIALDNSTISGSLTVTNGITGSFSGSISNATSASRAETASLAISASYLIGGGNTDTGSLLLTSSFNNFTSSYKTDSASFSSSISSLTKSTSSYVLNSQTSSFTLNAQTSSFVLNSQTSSMSVLSASYAINFNEKDPIFVNKSASLATTGSNNFIGTQNISGSTFISSSLYVTSTITASIISASQFTGSLFGTASQATNSNTASYVITSQTASYYGGSVVSASYASTASYILSQIEYYYCTIDGQGGVIANGSQALLRVPFTGTIVGWQLFECSSTPISSSVTLDAWKTSYVNYPPTVANTIFGTKPALSGSVKNQASGLLISASVGDLIIINVDSNLNGIKYRFGFDILR